MEICWGRSWFLGKTINIIASLVDYDNWNSSLQKGIETLLEKRLKLMHIWSFRGRFSNQKNSENRWIFQMQVVTLTYHI